MKAIVFEHTCDNCGKKVVTPIGQKLSGWVKEGDGLYCSMDCIMKLIGRMVNPIIDYNINGIERFIKSRIAG